MKWIGQHIYDLISRFRSDVYLEDISTGTIASGGNLGLDSSNKIVKATIASGSGDITGVTITTDSGGGSAASDTAGSADFSILGANGVGVTNSGTTITAAAVPGEIDHDSLNNFVANKHIDWTGASAGTVHSSNIPTLNQDTTGNARTANTATALETARDIAGVSFDGSASISLNNNAITNGAGYTTNTGDITGVSITTDSGGGSKAEDTGGSADFSILGTSGVGVTNSGATITVASVPAEIDHDSLSNFAANEHFTQANITTVGTVDTGTWEGTDIATDQQKHLAHFCFKGYATGDGTNYEMQDFLSDTNAPYEHNTSIGSDGLTATTQQVWMRTGGTVMPRAGTLKNWTGWAASAGSGTVDIGLFKVTPSRNTSSSISAVLLKNTQFSALGNAKLEDFAETSFSVTFAAGDMIVSAVKNSSSGKICYFSSTLEIEWD